MQKTLVFDFSRVLIFPKNKSYAGSLNDLYKANFQTQGFDIFKFYKLNEILLNYVAQIKQQGCAAYIFTSGKYLHTDTQIAKQLSKAFDNIFNTESIGFEKDSPKAYIALAKKLKADPEAMLFIDDTKENIKAAIVAGLNTLLYKTNKKTIAEITKFLSS